MTQWALATDPPRAPVAAMLLASVLIAPALICDPSGLAKREWRCGTTIAMASEPRLLPDHDMVITPSQHPDAREWPRGMVIRPPATNDRINLLEPSFLDTVLSALGVSLFAPATSSDPSLL